MATTSRRVTWALAFTVALAASGVLAVAARADPAACAGPAPPGARQAALARLSGAAIPPPGWTFATADVWTTPTPASVGQDPESAAIVGDLRRQVDRYGVWINATRWSTPVVSVGAAQPRVRVALDRPADLQADFDAVPLPADARPADGSDRHLVLVQNATGMMWEFWKLRRDASGWHAGWGGALPTATSPGYFACPSYLGATATSLPLIGGLIRVSELRSGAIRHAVSLGLPENRAGTWAFPAQRTDGVGGSRTPPAGTRFRLDPKLDIPALGLPRAAQAIAFAAQRYGMVVRDTSGAVSLYAEDPGTAANPYPALYDGLYPDKLLARFPWSRLQVTPQVLSTPTPPATPAASLRTRSSGRRAALVSERARRAPAHGRAVGHVAGHHRAR